MMRYFWLAAEHIHPSRRFHRPTTLGAKVCVGTQLEPHESMEKCRLGRRSVRRWIVATVTAVAVLLVPAARQLATLTVHAEPAAQKQDPHTITVYVTRTGAKYHRAECRYLSRSKIAVALAEAANYYVPCSVCRPPVPR